MDFSQTTISSMRQKNPSLFLYFPSSGINTPFGILNTRKDKDTQIPGRLCFLSDNKVCRVLQPDPGVFLGKEPASEVGKVLDGYPGNVFFRVITMEDRKG